MQAILASSLLLALTCENRLWDDEIVYGIIIEKFFDGDPVNNFMKDQFMKDRGRLQGGFWGGDLKGIIDKLDDLTDLGVTSVLIYPVIQNDENPIGKFLPTGYRPKDYEQIDRNFGDLATLRTLIGAAHERKLRVILDMPITLPGFEHPYLTNPSKKAWFGPQTEYGTPRWKVENPEVADYLIDVCKRWKERSGCDGFRIDSAHLQPVAFWKRFVRELKAAPPAGPFLILPELTINPREIGKFVSEAGFDGAYDFSFLRVREVFGRDENVNQLSFIASQARQFYPSPRTMMAAIDNYEDAFMTYAKEPKAKRTKLALTYLLTLDRVPLLYAGNELGLAVNQVGDAFPTDRLKSLFLQDIKALIALRKREPTLRRGSFSEILARDSLYAFLRTLGDERILIVLNGSNQQTEFAMPIGDIAWKSSRLENLVTGDVDKRAESESPLQVGAFSARIVKVK